MRIGVNTPGETAYLTNNSIARKAVSVLEDGTLGGLASTNLEDSTPAAR